jgi:hypothetical protein
LFLAVSAFFPFFLLLLLLLPDCASSEELNASIGESLLCTPPPTRTC